MKLERLRLRMKTVALDFTNTFKKRNADQVVSISANLYELLVVGSSWTDDDWTRNEHYSIPRIKPTELADSEIIKW